MCQALDGACEAFQRDFPECYAPIVEGTQWLTEVRKEHILEGAEYNTGCPNAYQNKELPVMVSLMCKRCGIEADYEMNWVRRKGTGK